MRAFTILLSIVVPGVAVGLRLGVFDGIAVSLLLLGLNQQLVALSEVIVKTARR